MRALLEDLRSGEVAAHEIPQPELRPGGILVRTFFSAISSGTELKHREQVEKSLAGKALARPDLVRQVLDFARAEGVKAAYQRVQARLDTLAPLGYSCAGTVIAAGQGAEEFQPGQQVACAGTGYAAHSEVNFVPRNLAARIPPGVPLEAASLTAIGAIALQGFRQSQAVLGEVVAVVGAGLVGVLTILLAKAAGCRVISLDHDQQRAESARRFGADAVFCSREGDAVARAREFAAYGADAAIVTAAAASAEPVELAAELCRERGRIVVVGTVGLGASRQLMYEKELSLVLSRSYGPGRYDTRYEEEGIDYPVGYVRWTEKRNMEAFLELLAAGKIDVSLLLEKRRPAGQGAGAYEGLKRSRAYTVLLGYPSRGFIEMPAPRPVRPQTVPAPARNELRVGCIGAGGFARSVLFPALRKARGVRLHAVASASGVAAESARRLFGFERAAQPAEVLQDAETDAVFVLSRHDSHARYVIAALTGHKPVFVEKPLAVHREELNEIRCAYQAEIDARRHPFLMVGFNRRFAPFTEILKQHFAGRREPMLIHVRVNAGALPVDHWTQQSAHGGRIVGEMCHFVDWARCLVGSPIARVSAQALAGGACAHGDNVVANLTFQDGSMANLVYLANGDRSVPKELMEVFCEGQVGRVDDFRGLELAHGGKMKRRQGRRDKGHEREIQLTLEALRRGGPAPIAFEELVEVSAAVFAIAEAVGQAQTATLPDRPSRAPAV